MLVARLHFSRGQMSRRLTLQSLEQLRLSWDPSPRDFLSGQELAGCRLVVSGLLELGKLEAQPFK